MKKNTMMRIASVLLVAVLLSTCTISGTFAKYVTEGTGTDSARVAKFGVEVKADYSTLFNKTYTTHTAWTGDDGVSVNATVDVVAPGTDGSLADFTVTGTPEVDVNVSYTVDLKLNNWKVDTDGDGVAESEYCPIVITVNDTSYSIDGTNIKNVAALETAVETAITNSAKNYNAGTNLADENAVAKDLNVSWKWHFMGAGETNGTGPSTQWDKYDTQLGDAAAEDNAATIELTVTCTVTQID